MTKRIALTLLLVFGFIQLYSQQTSPKSIHVMVALCDNKYQGIVKVPKAIGNGQDPDNNLYWGCGYGVRTFFKKSADWKEVKRYKNVNDIILERIVFKHKTANYYLVADAYDGKYISDCTIDFLEACAGQTKDTLMIDKTEIGINGKAKLIAYVGHNGLMDFKLANTYQNADGLTRDAIVIACASRQYFKPYMQSSKTNPVLWSTHLMSAEAYTVHDAIKTYIAGGNGEAIRQSAAEAYNRYQKCGIKGAKRLLVSGY